MKRVKNSLTQLNNLSAGVTTVLTLAVLLPVLVLCGFGLYAIIQYGYTLHFAIVLVATFLGLSGFPNEFFEKILLLKNYPNTPGLSPA